VLSVDVVLQSGVFPHIVETACEEGFVCSHDECSFSCVWIFWYHSYAGGVVGGGGGLSSHSGALDYSSLSNCRERPFALRRELRIAVIVW
jgi:hypothetical protein